MSYSQFNEHEDKTPQIDIIDPSYQDDDDDSDDEASLPASYIRQTPAQAIRSKLGVAGTIICAVLNFLVNLGIGYWSVGDADCIGWNSTAKFNECKNTYKSNMVGDMFLTAFFIAFLSSVLSNSSIEKHVKRGNAIPVEDSTLSVGLYKAFPLRVKSPLTRACILGIEAMLFYCGVTQIFFAILCSAGGMGSPCHMEPHGYVWMKAIWSGVLGALVYPLIFVAALNRRHLLPEVYDLFLEFQKLKLAEQSGQI